MNLTIAYCTMRQQPMFHWFKDSLMLQIDGVIPDDIQLVVVSPYAASMSATPFKAVIPKPSVWQGPYRLTKQDFFSASNSRNTAICVAKDGYIAFVDDLSALAPLWLQSVREAMAGGYIACGAFQKVKGLEVENGVVRSYLDYPQGRDSRWDSGRQDGPAPCDPSWMFGCSLAAPVQAFIDVNGYPEDWCDGLGYEDSVTGQMIAKHGYRFMYDRRMMTFESEEHHHNQPNMLRVDPGISPKDKSHVMIEKAKHATRFENYFGEGIKDLSDLRRQCQNGEPFQIRREPTHEWFTGKPLEEFP